MPPTVTHPRIESSLVLAELLFAEGARLAFALADDLKRKPARTRKSGITLRPGKATPLWNRLRLELATELGKWGSKANLARVMGVPRQTINTWLTGHSSMPDAERTLQLMAWLMAKRQGREPS